MKNILVIAPNFIGDSILAIPFLRELKKHVGRCAIDVVTKNAGLLMYKNCPYVRSIYDWSKLNILELKKNKYEKAYLLKRSLSSALLTFRLGIKDVVGFGGQFRDVFLSNVVSYDKSENKHELEHFMDILKADYVEINNKNLEFYVNESALESIKSLLSDKKRVLIVAKSSTYVKDWSVENFAKVVDYFVANGYAVYFAGLEKEKEYCGDILLSSSEGEIRNLCGKLSFDEVIALVSQMDVVFGVDSGFGHVASAFGKKVVTLFGPTSVSQWSPVNAKIISLNLSCAPCSKPKKCKQNYSCMKNITPEVVIEKLKEVL